MNTMNKEQVAALFQREAVLLGTEDAVPTFRAAALFGEEAVQHARRMVGEDGYGIGDYTAKCLTLRGFQTAASFYNVQQLREEAPA